MAHRPVLVTPPADLPVSVADAKRYAIVEHEDDDQMVEGMIRAAVQHLDGFSGILGRCLISQTWRLEMIRLERFFILPLPDVTEVTIAYDGLDGVEQTILPENVSLHPVALGTRVDLDTAFVLPGVKRGAYAPVRVNFTAGYGAPGQVPFPIKNAIMRMVSMSFDERYGGKPDPVADAMLAPYRWLRV